MVNRMPTLPETVLAQVEQGLETKGVQIFIEDFQIEHKLDLEFVLSPVISGKQIGDSIHLRIENGSQSIESQFELIPYFAQTPFAFINLAIGLLCIGIGAFVFILRREDIKGRLFYFWLLALATAIVLVGGYQCLDSTYITSVVFYICYVLALAILLHLSLAFSPRGLKLNRLLIYVPPVLLIIVLEYSFIYSSISRSIQAYRAYQNIIYFFRSYLIVYAIATVLHFIFLFKKSEWDEERAQIKWILYGLIVGFGPFVLLYQLPKVLTLPEILSMDLSMTFAIFLPVAIGIAIVRFRLLDIELLINRSLVYAILTVFIVGLYIFLIQIFENLFSRLFLAQDTFVSALAAIGAAVAFHPARKKIQDFVDRSFFRMSYDYRKSIQSFHEQAQRIVHKEQLVEFFHDQVNINLPVEYMGLIIYVSDYGHTEIWIRRDKEKVLGGLSPDLATTTEVLSRKKAVRMEENIDFSWNDMLGQMGLEIVIPISFSSTSLSGLAGLGRKRSGERFTRDDISLLKTLSQEMAMNLERLKLQEEVVFERAEKEKLDEINRMKSEWITSVSHELRTPMSTIQSLSELLHEGKVKDQTKQDQLLSLMSNECNRLSHFLHNILDMGKIEQERKKYDFKHIDLKSIIQETVYLFDHRLQTEGFSLKMELPEEPVELRIDRDAVKQILTNLLDNAIKYSGSTKEILIRLIKEKDRVELSVADTGIGISQEEQEKIFGGFYRSTEASHRNPSGVGIGLKIVKHIMDAHKGKIRVVSQVGQGTVFIMVFENQ